jgi:ankyrin repeat protein
MEHLAVIGEQKIPWCQFIDAVHQESFLRQACLSFPYRRLEFIDTTGLVGYDSATFSREIALTKRLLDIPTFDGRIIGSLFNYNSYVHPVHFNSRPYLPPHDDTVIKFDILGSNAYLEMLKHIILVVSNNLDERLVHKLVDILANDSHARSIFTRIIGHDLVTLKACIERIWFPAVEYRNRALVQILIDAGVDLNIRSRSKTYISLRGESGSELPPEITALQCAIEKGYDEITNLLLARNANDWHAKILHSSSTVLALTGINRFQICTLIDLAVKMDNPRLLQKLLDNELLIIGRHQSASHYTIRLAKMLGRFNLVEMILSKRPGLWDPSQYLHPLWAPALQPLFTAEDLLSNVNPTPSIDAANGTNLMPLRLPSTLLDTSRVLLYDTNHISSTTAASEPGLHSLVMEIKRRGFARPMKRRHLAEAQAYTVRDLKDLPPRLPALHVAICGLIIPLVAKLLQHGADSNQLCKAYPIQLATALQSLEMVDILIEHSCETDAAATDDYRHTWRNVDELKEVNLLHPAICYAWGKSRLDIVRSLLKAGAKFPVYDETKIRNALYNTHFLTSGAFKHSETEWTLYWMDYFDPWVDAIRFNTIERLRQIVQSEEKYIGHDMSTTHLARCILVHGTSCTLNSILNRDFLDSEMIRDPLILSALVYRGDLVMAKDVTRRLIKEFDHATFVHRYGARAFTVAISKNRESLIRMFLDSQVNPFVPWMGSPDTDSWRMDIWHWLERYASWFKRCGKTEYVPEENLPTEILLQAWCSSPFQAACAFKNYDVIKILLAWKPACRTSHFEHLRKSELAAAYLNAICSGHSELENLIAENGIDMDSVMSTMDASTVATHRRLGLQYAMYYGELPLAKRLLDLGADGNTPGIFVRGVVWKTPLQSAADVNETEGFVKILLELGADPNESVEMGSLSALTYAASHGHFENVKLLIKAGADINAAEKWGVTALQSAAQNGRLDMTIYLLENGADVKGRGNENYLRSVKSAWYNGYHTLARMIHHWKKKSLGEEDCESIESIIAPILNPEGRDRFAVRRRCINTTDSVTNDSDSDDLLDDGDDGFGFNSDDGMYVQIVYFPLPTHY